MVSGFMEEKDPRGVEDVILPRSYAPSTGDQLAFFTQETNRTRIAPSKRREKLKSKWSGLSNHERARHIYSIARHIQKHSRLISVLEAMENGKTVRKLEDVDVPLAVRHFYHHAGWAQIMDKELPNHDPLGVAQIIPWNFPFLMLAWKIAPAFDGEHGSFETGTSDKTLRHVVL